MNIAGAFDSMMAKLNIIDKGPVGAKTYASPIAQLWHAGRDDVTPHATDQIRSLLKIKSKTPSTLLRLFKLEVKALEQIQALRKEWDNNLRFVPKAVLHAVINLVPEPSKPDVMNAVLEAPPTDSNSKEYNDVRASVLLIAAE